MQRNKHLRACTVRTPRTEVSSVIAWHHLMKGKTSWRQRSSVSPAPDQNTEQSSVTAKFLAVIVPKNITHQAVIVNRGGAGISNDSSG